MKKIFLSILVVVLAIALFEGVKVKGASRKNPNEFSTILAQQEQLNIKGQKAFEKILASRGLYLKTGSREYIVELIAYVSDPSFKPLASKENTSIDFYASTVINKLSKEEEESILKEVMKKLPKESTENASIGSTSFTYNRDAAVSYALTYWNYPNPQYKDFDDGGGGDCTNFVSQCMYYGGVPMVNTIWPRTSSYDWYYYFNGPGYDDDEMSHPWINATSLYRHFSWGRPGLAELVDHDFQLEHGDIVQLSSDSSSEPYHSMFVTGVTDYGDVLLTYHAGNHTYKKNVSLRGLELQYGNDKFRRWHIIH